MKVSQIKELLSAYSDDDELMIAWNDRDDLMIESNQVWQEAILIYEDTSLDGFNDDCRWAINEAEHRLKTGEIK